MMDGVVFTRRVQAGISKATPAQLKDYPATG